MQSSKVQINIPNVRLVHYLIVFFLFSSALPAAAAPSLTIVTPTEEAVLVGSETVVVQFETGGYLFVDHAGNNELYPANPEAGHAHLWLDPLDGSREHAAARKLLGAGPVDLGMLDPGEHEVIIELAANEHSSLTPPLLQHRRFFVGSKPVVVESESVPRGFKGGLLLLAVLGALMFYRYRRKTSGNEGEEKAT